MYAIYLFIYSLYFRLKLWFMFPAADLDHAVNDVGKRLKNVAIADHERNSKDQISSRRIIEKKNAAAEWINELLPAQCEVAVELVGIHQDDPVSPTDLELMTQDLYDQKQFDAKSIDLLIVSCFDYCKYGILPASLRKRCHLLHATEIVFLPPFCAINRQTLSYAIYKYYKCEQRFGK